MEQQAERENLLEQAEAFLEQAESAQEASQKISFWKQAEACYEKIDSQVFWDQGLPCLEKIASSLDSSEKYEQAAKCRTDMIAKMKTNGIHKKKQVDRLAETFTYRGLNYYQLKNYAQEETDYKIAIQLRRALKNYKENYCNLSVLYCNYADTCLLQERVEEAEKLYDKSEAVLKEYIRTHKKKERDNGRICLARSYLERAEHMKYIAEKADAVTPYYDLAIAIYSSRLKWGTLTREEQEEITDLLAIAYNGRAGIYFNAKKYRLELKDYRRSYMLRQSLPKTTDNLQQTITVLRNCSDSMDELHRPAQALRYYRRILEIYEEMQEEKNTDAAVKDRIEVLLACAVNCDTLGSFEEAISYYSNALELLEKQANKFPENAELLALGYFRRGMDHCREKAHLYGKGLQDYALSQEYLQQLPETAEVLDKRICLLRTRGDLFCAMSAVEEGKKDFASAEQLELKKAELFGNVDAAKA